MRIGIDARQLRTPIVGTGRYLIEILREWSHLNNEHEVFLYSPQAIDPSFAYSFHRREGSSIARRLGGTIWLQTELPFMARRDKIDVFWATTDIAPLPLIKEIPCLLTVHDLGFYRIPDQLPLYVRFVYKLFFWRSLKSVSAISCTTTAVKNELYQMGVKRPIHVLPHGVSPIFANSHADPDSILRRHDIHRPFFFFVGHLRPNKNIERLLVAFENFITNMSPADRPLLVLVGGRTNTDAVIIKLFQKPSLKPYVLYLGFLPDNELIALYKKAMAFVSPSLYEGFGLPYLEAMSAGLPVIAPSIATVREVCGEAALYVDPTDTASIQQGLENCNADLQLRSTLSQKGLVQAKKFSWKA